MDTLYLAVADYGNARVQIFDLHGVLAASLTEEIEGIGRPCRLAWRAPFLEVEGVDGVRTRVHLGAALLVHDAAREPVTSTVRAKTPDMRWAIC